MKLALVVYECYLSDRRLMAIRLVAHMVQALRKAYALRRPPRTYALQASSSSGHSGRVLVADDGLIGQIATRHDIHGDAGRIWLKPKQLQRCHKAGSFKRKMPSS